MLGALAGRTLLQRCHKVALSTVNVFVFVASLGKQTPYGLGRMSFQIQNTLERRLGVPM